MADVIHHEDSASNTLMIVIVIIILAVAAFLLWRFLPGRQADENGNNVDVNVSTPAGTPDNSAGSNPY